MNLSRCQPVVRELTDDLQQLPVCYVQLEESITWLMDKTFESKDGDDKVRLAATELRARGVLERYRKANIN